jgi:hypothetical protein
MMYALVLVLRQVLKLDCGRQDPPPEMWAGLSGLTGLQWLCLRWLEALPVACLAPLSNLVVLQLKAITRPPGAHHVVMIGCVLLLDFFCLSA